MGTTHTEGKEPSFERISYKDSTYEIVSMVAYLIGVNRHIFENENESPKIDVYERLESDKSARIIRNFSLSGRLLNVDSERSTTSCVQVTEVFFPCPNSSPPKA